MSGQHRDGKDWKAITFDWLALQDYDHVATIGICLTQRQVAILKSLLTTAYWSTRWTNLGYTPDELDEFVSQIDYKLDGNDCVAEMIDFRDNPQDPCEVQYTTDGGVTWSTMFRKDNCAAPSNETTITKIYNDITLISNNHTTWAGDIINVAPQWEYTDPDQDNALCLAIQMYVDAICDQAVAQIERANEIRRDENDWLFDMVQVISSAVITAIAVLTLGITTAPASLVGAFAWASVTLAEAAWDRHISQSVVNYQDENARQTISCYMWEQIVGSTPQHPAWRDSLLNWDSFGGNEEVIAEEINAWNQDEDVYISWMILWEELNSIADVLPACPCPDTWEHTWDIENIGLEAWEIVGGGLEPGPYGTYSAGVGVECEHGVIANGWHWNSVFRLKLDEEIDHIQSVEVTYDAVKGTWDSTAEFMILTLLGLGTGDWSEGDLSTGDGQTKEFVHSAEGTANGVQIFFRVADYEPGVEQPNGSGVITKVKLGGVGIDPFAGRITS